MTTCENRRRWRSWNCCGSAALAYSNPWVPKFPRKREHHFELESTALTADILAGFDCALVATNHDAFDYELIRRNARLVVDTRGIYRRVFQNVIKA